MQTHTKDTHKHCLLLKKPQCRQNAHLIPTCPSITRPELPKPSEYDKTLNMSCSVACTNGLTKLKSRTCTEVSKRWLGLSSAFTWRTQTGWLQIRVRKSFSSSRSNDRGMTDRSSPAGLSHIHVVVFYRHETTEDVFAEVKQVPPFRMTGANVNGSGCGFHFSYMHWLWPMIYTLCFSVELMK